MGYIGQTASQTLEVCQSALDGVLFIDEVGMLADNSKEFSGQAVEAVGKFIDDHRDRIVVILADTRTKMPSFLPQYPDFARRFVTIDFPGYEADELCAILRGMARTQNYDAARRSGSQAQPVDRAYKRQQWWHGAREMQFLLGKAREAQGERIARNPGADRKTIEMDDIMTAAGIS